MYVTVFRDPLDRALSHYNHVGRRMCKCSLSAFVRLMKNYYTIFMSGEPRSSLGTKSNAKRLKYSIEKAKSNLVNGVSLTGVISDLNSWWEALQLRLHQAVGLRDPLPPIGFYNVRNVSMAIPSSLGQKRMSCDGNICAEFTNDELQLGKLYNAFDMSLYELACELAANQTNLALPSEAVSKDGPQIRRKLKGSGYVEKG